MQLFTRFAAGLIWYLFINPLMTIFFFLKDIGLIWSLGFYVLSEFLFLDTFIQDYRILITIVLFIPFVIKTIRGIYWSLERLSLWEQNRAFMKEKKLREKEEANNFYEQE